LQVFSSEHRCDSMRARLNFDHGNDSSGPVLLYVGRIGKEKRLEGLRQVLQAIPEATLAIVGAGPYEEEMRKHFAGCKVKFLGPMTGELIISFMDIQCQNLISSCCAGLSLSQAYASSDIFVMPSDTETLGFVAMEAAASGLPTVGMRAGGLVDVIVHNVTGYLCDCESGTVSSMNDFCTYTRRLVEDVGLRKQMGQAARALASEWSWDEATKHLRNDLYPLAIRNHRKYNSRIS
jgi:sulfoquinovosyltransferase